MKSVQTARRHAVRLGMDPGLAAVRGDGGAQDKVLGEDRGSAGQR